jgi:microcystin-dependent protein
MMKKFRAEIVRFAATICGIGLLIAGLQLLSPADATVWKWSQTAGTNATVDSTINWAEGQSPGSVNDSARAMMAAVAKYRDDLAGSVTTGGTSTAYTITTNQGLTVLTAGFKVCFSPHTTSGGTATLVVDGLAAKPLRIAPASELPIGALVQGTPYCAAYFTSNSGEYILQSFFGNPYNVPLGGIISYLGSTAPNSNFALPFGQAISRTTYAGLFALVSTTFGSGDGSTTFNLPDLRGRMVAGLGNMGGSDAARLTNFTMVPNGTTIGAVGGVEFAGLTIAQLPTFTPAGSVTSTGAVGGNVSVSTPTGSVSTSVSLNDPGHTHPYITRTSNGALVDAPGSTHVDGFRTDQTISTTSNTTGITVSSATSTFTGNAQTATFAGFNLASTVSLSFAGTPVGSSNAVSRMPPTIVLPYIVRIF